MPAAYREREEGSHRSAMTPTVTIPLSFWRCERVASLSPRERQVVSLAACGYDNMAISQIDGVSVSTVRSQIHSAMTKLGCRTRIQMVMVAMFAGVVDLDMVHRELKVQTLDAQSI